MPSLKEVAEKVNYLLSNGDDNAERKCHFGLIDIEAKERAENPKGRTRFQVDTDCPDMYAAFNVEKDRYIAAAGNKSVALSIMLRCWQQLSDETIHRLAEDQSEEKSDEDFVMGRETLGDA